jgi:NAD(P)-dependent dehydrogenase (short-subunit alcohol dehydrogenase family)
MKNPKSILITGGSSGIGQGLLLSYAREGVTLAFNGRDESRVNEVHKLLVEKGAKVFSTVLDVRDYDGMKKWIEEIDEQAPLDLVIANAGVSPKGDMSLDEKAKLIYDINVYGVFNTIHPAIDLMKRRGKGQIAIVSSLAGYVGLPKSPEYSSSKAAVKAYGRGLRSRLARDGIEVSVICPGWVPSRITDQHKEEIPFFVSVDYAVRRIRRGLERNAGLISFPPMLAFAVWWLMTWPDWMQDFVNKRFKN